MDNYFGRRKIFIDVYENSKYYKFFFCFFLIL